MPKAKALKKPGKQESLLTQLERDAQSVYAKPKKPKMNITDVKDNHGNNDIDDVEMEENNVNSEEKIRRHNLNDDDDDNKDDGNDSHVIKGKMSQKILTMAREQLEEEEEEEDDDNNTMGIGLKKRINGLPSSGHNKIGSQGRNNATSLENLKKGQNEYDFEEEDDYDDGIDEDEVNYMSHDPMADMGLSEEDEKALAQFMGTSSMKTRNLGDLIMEKLQQLESGGKKTGGVDETVSQFAKKSLSPQVVQVYTSVGKLMKRYRSGKIPKALKIIPVMKNWEEVLYITHPEEWSPQAMFAATRIFASNLNPRMAQRFYNLILLPAVRQDIFETKKLNYHLYMSLKKALYKPAAFFKGILIPLCEDDCTLREAVIVGSVVEKVSVPMMHSAACIMRLAITETYSGATSLFLRVLLNKKYSLPYKVIDAVVKHFLHFKNETRTLPVLWHQALLVFAERYKLVLTDEQRDALKTLLRQKNLQHYKITPEIRRELFISPAVQQSTLQRKR